MHHDDWLMTGLPDYDEGIEADEDDMQEAEDELGEDLDALRQVLEESPWISEHASFLYVHCEKFKDEMRAKYKDWLNERAQAICDSRHSSDPSDSLP